MMTSWATELAPDTTLFPPVGTGEQNPSGEFQPGPTELMGWTGEILVKRDIWTHFW